MLKKVELLRNELRNLEKYAEKNCCRYATNK